MNPIVASSRSIPAHVTSDALGKQLIAATLLGLVVLYGVAFAPTPLLHNAAHDVRHVAATPCH